jgi:phenylpyruvate tautomerase PptA (4-oxalocrotonate tautomerase family)
MSSYAAQSASQETQATATIYPNPTNSVVNININNSGGESDFMKNIIVANMSGVVVKRLQTKDNNIQIELSDLPSGSYVVVVAGGSLLKKQIIVKE